MHPGRAMKRTETPEADSGSGVSLFEGLRAYGLAGYGLTGYGLAGYGLNT